MYLKIDYNVEVYGNTSAKNTYKIQAIQNKLLKLILKWDWRTPTNLIHKALNILKVEGIFQYNFE